MYATAYGKVGPPAAHPSQQTLEFDYNTDANAPVTALARRHFEQLLRKLLQRQAAVVVLHHYAFNWSRPAEPDLGTAEGVYWWQPEMHHSTLARVSTWLALRRPSA